MAKQRLSDTLIAWRIGALLEADMTKLERVTGITLLTALVCTLQFAVIEHVYARVAAVISDLAKALAQTI